VQQSCINSTVLTSRSPLCAVVAQAKPDTAHAETNLADDVPGSGFVLAAVTQREGVQPKAGEGSEAAQNAHKQELRTSGET
jgi:hypothetical protein